MGLLNGSSLAQHATGRPRTCLQCGLHRTEYKIDGKGEKEILLLGNHIGFDGQNKYSMELLNGILFQIGIDMQKDCWHVNAINCKGSQYSSEHIDCCRNRLWPEVARIKPKLVFLLGLHAVQAWFGDRWSGIGELEPWVGWTIPDHRRQCWVVPMAHPGIVKRDQRGDVNIVLIKNCMLKGLRMLNKTLPTKPLENMVDILDGNAAISLMENWTAKPPEWVTFDYETTGIRPYQAGHDIVCASICSSIDKAYAFMLDSADVRRAFVALLQNDSKKIAQNAKFEDQWTRQILQTKVKNWSFDTMLAAHVLNNAKGVVGLKFQAFVRYGVHDYAAEIEHYIKSGHGKGRIDAINSIKRAPKRILLTYCGLDALLEHRLAMDQMQELGLFDEKSIA